ncbi:Crp/Fnr family transcriptional regulator [Caloramator sp. E03]|uniref:Crp/Fnr family transcriptional regulator n=1 Tax=Caloramator sp. E03 TaxID=2576307 RepID=UPI0011105316|nr:Crp/Fnr family transcriptional regulator [Caloramator sp. E03]QCX33510.1 Crp/Fnr family transcriptional regulator [Caloramator sp. E03]
MKLERFISSLKNFDLFKEYDEKGLLKIFKELNYKIVEYKNEDVIFFENEECRNLSLILEGGVRIQKIDSLGRVLTVAEFDAFDIFGENLIFGNRDKYPMTVVSNGNSIILHIEKQSVIKLCLENQKFHLEFLKTISNKAIVLSTKLKEVTLKTIRQRICEYLLWQYSIQKTNTIYIGMSKKEWADKIGVQRPSLSRELIKMKEEDLIDYDKDTITIKNIKELENYIV